MLLIVERFEESNAEMLIMLFDGLSVFVSAFCVLMQGLVLALLLLHLWLELFYPMSSAMSSATILHVRLSHFDSSVDSFLLHSYYHLRFCCDVFL